MEHKQLDQLLSIADIQTSEPVSRMTRPERIKRWIALLNKEPMRRLNALDEIEYMLPSDRPLARADDSPLTVAYNDPVFRREGLKSDRLGDVMALYKISEKEAHHAFCSCLGGHTMDSSAFARRLHDATIGRARVVSGAWVLGGLLIGLPALLALIG
jgi:hypothetical protein